MACDNTAEVALVFIRNEFKFYDGGVRYLDRKQEGAKRRHWLIRDYFNVVPQKPHCELNKLTMSKNDDEISVVRG